MLSGSARGYYNPKRYEHFVFNTMSYEACWPIHLLVFFINNNPMSKFYQRRYKCFDANVSYLVQGLIMLCNVYHCDLTTTGIKLENVRYSKQ